jgi:hypothetical protein
MSGDYGDREVTPEDRRRAVLHELANSRSNVRITEGMVRGLASDPNGQRVFVQPRGRRKRWYVWTRPPCGRYGTPSYDPGDYVPMRLWKPRHLSALWHHWRWARKTF